MRITVCFLLLVLLCSVSSETELQQQSSVQQSSLQDIHAALRELTASVAQQKVEITILQKQNEDQAAKLKELEEQKSEVEKQKNEINQLNQQRQAEQVAFSASLLASGEATTGPFPPRTTLIFKHVVTNIGNSYNSNTGVFTAPVRGLYHFEFHIGVHAFNTAAVLVKNTNLIFAAYEEQIAGYGSSSQSASLLLEVGDAVFVRVRKESKVYDSQYHQTTFSGHLLFNM